MAWSGIRNDTASIAAGAEYVLNCEFSTDGELRVRPGYQDGELPFSAGPVRALVAYNPTESSNFFCGVTSAGAEVLNGGGLTILLDPRRPRGWERRERQRRDWPEDPPPWKPDGWPPPRPPRMRRPQPGEYTVQVSLDESFVNVVNQGNLSVTVLDDGANTNALLGEQIAWRVYADGDETDVRGSGFQQVTARGAGAYGATIDLSYTLTGDDDGVVLTYEAYVVGWTEVSSTTATAVAIDIEVSGACASGDYIAVISASVASGSLGSYRVEITGISVTGGASTSLVDDGSETPEIHVSGTDDTTTYTLTFTATVSEIVVAP